MLAPPEVHAASTVEVLALSDLHQRLKDEIYEKTNGVVQAGPFRGMQLYPDRGWPESNIAAELLGFFEQELHGHIETQIARLAGMDNPKVVNVGCAEGYYAVGLARRLPKATVYVIEPDQRSMFIAKKNAENNGVSIIEASPEEAFASPDLVVMDCEGAEVEYIDLTKYPGLRNAFIIAEMHQLPDTDDVLRLINDRVIDTHIGELVFEGARNPNVCPLLWNKNSLDRWLVVCESRPCIMAWAVLKPKEMA